MKIYVLNASHYDNEDGSAVLGVYEDENKAREVMAEFSSDYERYHREIQAYYAEFRKGLSPVEPRKPKANWAFYNIEEHEVIQ